MPNTQDSIIAKFDKLDLDTKVILFNSLKEILTEELIKAAQEHEEAQGRMLSIKDKINNGK